MVFWWIITGWVVWVYYMLKRDYIQQLIDGDIPLLAIVLGYALTLFLWPVTIYNQEFRKK